MVKVEEIIFWHIYRFLTTRQLYVCAYTCERTCGWLTIEQEERRSMIKQAAEKKKDLCEKEKHFQGVVFGVCMQGVENK